MAADPMVPTFPPSPAARKKLVRRPAPDRSQRLRFVVQGFFLLLNVWVGARFYIWVRHVEAGVVPRVARPDGVEGFLPIAALMNLKAWVLTGEIPRIHPAAMFLLIAFLGISLLLRKAFCSWICPVGTVSEGLWKLGRMLMLRNLEVPRWLDVGLRALKYVLLALFLYAVGSMSAEAIAMFMQSPYGVVADVKMLNFFRFIGTTALGVTGFLVVMSILVKNFWCRYLCPYGALMGIVALASPTAIRRDADACIDCSKCTKACPQRLPVERLRAVRSAECTLCMECVAVCPARGALEAALPARRRLSPGAIAAAIALIFFGIVAAARVTGHWKTELPLEVYQRLVPLTQGLGHP
jgi:polyferredoxin